MSHSGEATKLRQERNRLLIALITLNNVKRNDSYTTSAHGGNASLAFSLALICL